MARAPLTRDEPTCELDLFPVEQLTRHKLERHLWSAAEMLRGTIDAADYKGFIFSFLFLKRLSDRFDEEMATRPDGADAPTHDFFVPECARWSELRKTTTGLGEALNRACLSLEEHNPRLAGVLVGVNFNDERKLGDQKSRDLLLGKLVQHFGGLNLRNSNLAEPDMLGRAYEALVEKFADDARKRGGEFYTPRMVAKLLVEILQPREGMRVCDPTVGSGGMLMECAHFLKRKGQNPRKLVLAGQEKNLGTWAICKMNMLLHGLPDADIRQGDTIRDPKLRDDDGLMRFDRVIGNPPFSLEDWGREEAERDPYGRFRFGIPTNRKGDLAFVQHMLATTSSAGMVGVVLPHGALFRSGSEAEIRKRILQEDLVEAVVALPEDLFHGTGIPAAILILNRAKIHERKGKVLFIDASQGFEEAGAQNRLRDEDVSRIAATFHAFQDVPAYARVVTLEAIEKGGWSWSAGRYVTTEDTREKVDVQGALATLRKLEEEREEVDARMRAYLKELGYDP
ncbi:MAG: class I SAM-dependent DNA methyltransferase [Myxococcota bacterium]